MAQAERSQESGAHHVPDPYGPSSCPPRSPSRPLSRWRALHPAAVMISLPSRIEVSGRFAAKVQATAHVRLDRVLKVPLDPCFALFSSGYAPQKEVPLPIMPSATL